MKDNNYYVVYGWMVNKLKLKGTALQLYAVIYGFSQDGDSECSGSLAFLAETTGCTKQTILNGLDKLERLGYIQKRQTRDSDGGLRNHYRVNLSAIESTGGIPQSVESECGKTVESKVGTPKNFTHEVKKSQCPQSKNKNAPSQKSRPNNTIREYIDYATFIMNDKTIASLRKLKDNNGAYLWQPSCQMGEPDRILGYPIYTSAYAPENAVAFGDYKYYNIGDRGTRSFKQLNELFAGNGMIGFVAKERVDGKLVLPEAVQILKLS